MEVVIVFFPLVVTNSLLTKLLRSPDKLHFVHITQSYSGERKTFTRMQNHGSFFPSFLFFSHHNVPLGFP